MSLVFQKFSRTAARNGNFRNSYESLFLFIHYKEGKQCCIKCHTELPLYFKNLTACGCKPCATFVVFVLATAIPLSFSSCSPRLSFYCLTIYLPFYTFSSTADADAALDVRNLRWWRSAGKKVRLALLSSCLKKSSTG